jgi:hypothetical protein
VELRDFNIDFITEQMLNGGPHIFVSNTEKLFIEMTSCLHPVVGP